MKFMMCTLFLTIVTSANASTLTVESLRAGANVAGKAKFTLNPISIALGVSGSIILNEIADGIEEADVEDAGSSLINDVISGDFDASDLSDTSDEDLLTTLASSKEGAGALEQITDRIKEIDAIKDRIDDEEKEVILDVFRGVLVERGETLSDALKEEYLVLSEEEVFILDPEFGLDNIEEMQEVRETVDDFINTAYIDSEGLNEFGLENIISKNRSGEKLSEDGLESFDRTNTNKELYGSGK